jgi:hypothetical protein
LFYWPNENQRSVFSAIVLLWQGITSIENRVVESMEMSQLLKILKSTLGNYSLVPIFAVLFAE